MGRIGNEEIGTCDTEGSIEELKVLGRHQAVAIEIDSKAYAVITDHFGNTAQLIAPCTGNPIANYRYSAFGEYDKINFICDKKEIYRGD